MVELVFKKLFDLGVVIEFGLMFLLFELGLSLDELVKFLYFGQFCGQNLMLGFYQTVEQCARLYFFHCFLDLLVVHGLYIYDDR